MNLGTSASATLWFDVEIRFYASSNAVELYVPTLYQSSGSGLCGNFNDDPTDDLIGPDLTVYPNTEEGLSEFDCSWTWSQEECSCGITEAECVPNNQVIEVYNHLFKLYLNCLFFRHAKLCFKMLVPGQLEAGGLIVMLMLILNHTMIVVSVIIAKIKLPKHYVMSMKHIRRCA